MSVANNTETKYVCSRYHEFFSMGGYCDVKFCLFKQNYKPKDNENSCTVFGIIPLNVALASQDKDPGLLERKITEIQ